MVGRRDQFLEFGRDHQHAQALVGEVAQQLEDLGLGADIDAARRLVDDQQARVHAQPARQQHLLLVAAGKLADRLFGRGAFDAERLDVALDDLLLLGAVDNAGLLQARQDGKRQVLAHAHLGNDALDLAVLRDEADAVRDGVGGLGIVRFCRPSTFTVPPSRRSAA